MISTSLSENNGIAALSSQDKLVYSVGISTGGASEMRMAKSAPHRRVIATTMDPVGAAFAQNQIKHAGLCKQIDVRIENVAEPLPYPNEHFDFIYARLVLHYLSKSELDRALGELHRILKTSGRIFIVMRSIDTPDARSKDSLFDPQTGMTTSFSNGLTARRCFHSEESIQQHLTSAGFQIQHLSSYEEQLCLDFHRTKPAEDVDVLIEMIARK